MSYEYVTKYDSPNFGYPTGTRGQNHPEEIIIHHWGSDGQSFNGVVSWLCNPAAGVSAHYVAEGGRVACLVNHADAAWHAGSKYHNTHSIGIECRPEMTSADLQTVAELIANIWKAEGKKLKIIGHKDVASTSCPGRYYAKLGILKQMAEAIYNGTGWIKDKIGWWFRRSDGSFPKNEWEKVDGKWYRFDGNGYMVTGWQQINGHWFYLADSGAMKTGWLKYNNHWFFFDENGYMVTGWLKYNGYWFYFLDSGIMKTGWVQYKDKWYYCSEKDGKMISDEFRKVKGDWYRFAPDGQMLEKTTLEVGKDGKISV